MIVKKEARRYGFDHTAVGVAPSDFWKIEEEVAEAVLIITRAAKMPSDRSLRSSIWPITFAAG